MPRSRTATPAVRRPPAPPSTKNAAEMRQELTTMSLRMRGTEPSLKRLRVRGPRIAPAPKQAQRKPTEKAPPSPATNTRVA